jgi:hypothetical protein
MILLAFSVSSAYSCDCNWQSVRQKFRDADVVFLGEVLAFDVRPGTETNEELKFFPYQATFKVEKQWKGKKQSEITALVDLKLGGMCEGSEMPVGKRFLIYAPRKSGQLLVSRNFCSGNWAADSAKKEIKKLNNFFYRTYTFFYPFPKF